MSTQKPGTDDQSEDLEFLLKELHDTYGSKLPSKFAVLEKAINQVRSNPEDTTLISEACSEAHKIKGAAGSHGFSIISEQAETLEGLLASLSSANKSEIHSIWNEIDHLLAEGKAEVIRVTKRSE